MIELFKVLNRVDNAGRGPGSNCVIGVLALKPSCKGARVASTNYDPIWLSLNFMLELKVFLIDKVSNICESLLGS